MSTSRFGRREKLTTTLMSVSAFVAAMIGGTTARADSTPVLQLQEVVVTAEKRSQPMEKVPISLAALSGRTLSQAGVRDIADLTHLVPTLDVQSSVGASTVDFRLRRVGNFGNIAAFEPDVGLFVDGAFRSRSFFGSGVMLDPDRIEVLNGPQSTLYGKNTTAGVVAIYSQAPAFTPTLRAEGDVGEMDAETHALMETAEASLSGPIGGGLRAGLSAGYSGNDYLFSSGFANGPGQDAAAHYSARSQLAYSSASWDARLIIEALGENGRSGSPDAETFAPGSPASNLHDLLIAKGLAPNCSGADPRDYGNCMLSPAQSNLQASDATLLWNYHFEDDVKLSSVTSWDHYVSRDQENDVVQLGAPILGFDSQQSGQSVQQELRLTSPSHRKVEWLGGAFLYHSEFRQGSPGSPTFYSEALAAAPFWKPLLQSLVGAPLLMGAPGQESFVNSTQNTDYLAGFGQVNWHLTHRLSIIGGLRWQTERKHAVIDQFQNDPTPTLMTAVINPTVPSTPLSRSAHKVTWSATPQLQITRSTMLYATAAEGFKSGGYNTGFSRLPADQREFGDETVRDYEAGFKSVLADGRVNVNGDVFDSTYHNYQDAAFVGAQFAVTNAARVTNRGAELSVAGVLTSTLSAGMNVSYANLRYADFTDGVCYPGRTPDGSVPGTCNLTGRHPIDAPPLKLSANLSYRKPVAIGAVFARIDATWTGRYDTSFSADPRLTQDPYTWLNARIGVDFGSTQLALWGKNLLNSRVANYDALLNLFSSDPSTQTYLQPPRSIGIMVRTEF
jgi:iron complex outermembrane recepter protein